MEKRTLEAAYKFYCDKELENAHSAEADTMATYEVLKAQLDRYPDLQNDVDKLSEFSSFTTNVDFAGRMVYNEDKKEVINFGKYKGKLVADVLKNDPGYYSWMMNGDFTLNTKKMLTEIRLRGFNSK
jgi:DNA polymerase-3 subunit epsilon